MLDSQNILLLTSKTGGGHISLAEALRDRLEQRYGIEMVDPQPSFFHLHYRLLSRYALWLWSAEFSLTDTPRQALFAHRLFTPLVAGELKRVIERVQPAMIITTYPFLTYEVMQVLTNINKTHIPFVLLFADPNGVHASWLTEQRASAVLAPTRETYEQALAAGFDPTRLHLVGWPVRAQFSQAATATKRNEILTKLGLDPTLFTIFLQGGGEGAAQFGQTIERVLRIGPNLQIILATGTNHALFNHFKSIPNLSPLPFTKEIAPFMAAADVIMGKAGPNMLFESVTLGKPFIATTYIPGQEQANLEFILRHKLGWIALEHEQQHTLLINLSNNYSVELQAMTETVATYRQWNTTANAQILPLLESLIH